MYFPSNKNARTVQFPYLYLRAISSLNLCNANLSPVLESSFNSGKAKFLCNNRVSYPFSTHVCKLLQCAQNSVSGETTKFSFEFLNSFDLSRSSDISSIESNSLKRFSFFPEFLITGIYID